MVKSLTILLALTFSVMFSSPSFTDWKKAGESVDGDTFYVDFERIRKHGGYVYYWQLEDLLKPDKHADSSVKVYKQGDCKLFRYKGLSWSFHKEPMGGGTGLTDNTPDKEWRHLSPKSIDGTTLKSVCAYAK